MRIVYKIVKGVPHDWYLTPIPKDSLFSCRTREDDGGVIYRVGEWAAPRIAGSKLLAFGSLQNAQDFEDRYPDSRVDQLYVAMAEGAAPIEFLNPSRRNHEAWWSHVAENSYLEGLSAGTGTKVNVYSLSLLASAIVGIKPPSGTLACDRIYLVHCISSWHKVGCHCTTCYRRDSGKRQHL